MSRLWSDDSWAHAGRIAEAYESNKLAWEEAPTAQEATATIDCHVCGAEVGARCVDKPQNLNKAQPKYPDSPSPDPTWRPDPDTIKVTAIEGADGRYGAVASADPDKAKRHAMALYVETHDSSLQKAECSCGWKTDWTSNDRRDRLIRRHLENRTLQKQED